MTPRHYLRKMIDCLWCGQLELNIAKNVEILADRSVVHVLGACTVLLNPSTLYYTYEPFWVKPSKSTILACRNTTPKRSIKKGERSREAWGESV
jgi:hypothetical protein